MPEQDAVVRALTHPETLQATDIPRLNAAGLSGFVRAHLPEDHPLREQLRAVTLNLSFRHVQVRREVRGLLQVWQTAGIPFILMKGFALAEFEYSFPAGRFYGDVDLLLPDDFEVIQRAQMLALAQGWRSDGMHTAPELWWHESMHLFSPDGQVRMDVHRHIAPTFAGLSRTRVRQLTRQFWKQAVSYDWEGLPVLRPDPLDEAVYVGLGRSWGGDQGGMKPADYTDLLTLTSNHCLGREELAHRARDWQGQATWEAFTELCNPWEKQFTLDVNLSSPVLHAAVKQDGLRPERARWSYRLSLLGRVTPQLPGALIHVLAAWAAVRAGGDPRKHLQRWTTTKPLGRARYRKLVDRSSAINLWVRVLYPRQQWLGVCVPRAYATFRSYQQLGHPVAFVSGVARGPEGITGHAWIEDDKGEIEFYGTGNRQAYRVNLKFPESL